jgi:Tol biopolymer transport system component
MQEIRIVSMEGGPTRVLQPDVRFLTSAYWSPDGRSFIATAQKELGRSGVYEIDARTGDVTAIVEPEHVGSIAPGHSPRWSPDRRGIYYAKGKGIVYRDVQTTSEREIVSPDESNFAYLNFDLSPDGRQLAIAGREQETRAAILQLFPINGGAPLELLRTKESAQIGPVTWTPDAHFVLFVLHGADDKEKGLSYISADGGQPRRLEISGVEAKTIQNVSIHPDGKQLALGTFGYRQNEIWAMENFLPPIGDGKTAGAAAAGAPATSAAAPQAKPAVPAKP